MNNIIFYFTGTGNSYHVASEIAKVLKNTKLVRIKKDMTYDYSFSQFDKIGFVYPVYFAAVPNTVNTFFKKLKIPSCEFVFTIATCGGMAVGVNDQVRRLLMNKLEIDSGYTIVMPSNNQTKYPPNDSKDLIMTSNKKISSIAREIQINLKKPIDKSITAIIAPTISRFMFPKSSDRGFELDNCNACGLCTKVCPNNNIVMKNNKPSWLHDCSRCNACLQLCPQRAIQFGSSRNWGRYMHPHVSIEELIVE